MRKLQYCTGTGRSRPCSLRMASSSSAVVSIGASRRIGSPLRCIRPKTTIENAQENGQRLPCPAYDIGPEIAHMAAFLRPALNIDKVEASKFDRRRDDTGGKPQLIGELNRALSRNALDRAEGREHAIHPAEVANGAGDHARSRPGKGRRAWCPPCTPPCRTAARRTHEFGSTRTPYSVDSIKSETELSPASITRCCGEGPNSLPGICACPVGAWLNLAALVRSWAMPFATPLTTRSRRCFSTPS